MLFVLAIAVNRVHHNLVTFPSTRALEEAANKAEMERIVNAWANPTVAA